MYYVSSSALLPALYTVCVEYITPTEVAAEYEIQGLAYIFEYDVQSDFFSKPVVSILLYHAIFLHAV